MRLTDQRPQVEKFTWSPGVQLVNYTSEKGDKLQAALFLPANYEKGKSYPTVVNFYEKMSQTANQFATPTANGFNRSVYTSNGYAVLVPDIVYRVNDPGMSAVWCMVPAVKAAIATGDRRSRSTSASPAIRGAATRRRSWSRRPTSSPPPSPARR